MRRARAAAQLLGGSQLDSAGVVRALLGVQAQDLRSARLALRARGAVPHAAGVNRALTEDRSVVAGWLMRGTLHLVAREDYGWLHGLTAGLSAATTRRRLAQLGASDATDAIVRLLADEGPLPRSAIGERLPVRTEGQILPHMLALAAASGQVVLGPVRDGAQCFVLARDWLGDAGAPVDREVALAALARRYLRGHGPATDADLAWWSGLPLRDARAGMAAVAVSPPVPPRRPLPPRLLPAFDPYMLGWRDRSFAVPEEHARAVHPGGGIIRGTAVVDGRVVGTWSRKGGAVVLAPFEPLPARVAAALKREAAAVERF